MTQNKTNTAAVNNNQDPNTENPVVGEGKKSGPERQSKTFKDRVLGMEKHAKGSAAGAGRLAKSGAKAIGRGATSLTREVIADTAAGAVGLVTTMAVGNLVNSSLCDAVNIVDREIGKRHPRTVEVQKAFGRRKTMSESDYFAALAKGKKFKKVKTNHFLLDHKPTVDTAVGAASYAMGAGAGVAAGLTTRATIKNQLVLNSQINKVVRTALDGSDYEEKGQI